MSESAPHTDDLVLGTAGKPYPQPQFRLAPQAQAYHGLIWGSTGTGKSKLLESIFLQHLNKGRGVALIDPHSDLALSCLSYLVSRGYLSLSYNLHPDPTRSCLTPSAV